MLCTLTQEQFSEEAKDDEKGKKIVLVFIIFLLFEKKKDI